MTFVAVPNFHIIDTFGHLQDEVQNYQYIKGTESWDFRLLFLVNNLPGPHMNRQKQFSQIFRFRKDIREKRVLAIGVVLNYAFIVSPKSLTTLTRWRNWRCLTDSKGTISRNIKYFSVFHFQYSNILAIWMGGGGVTYSKAKIACPRSHWLCRWTRGFRTLYSNIFIESLVTLSLFNCIIIL